jgi:hypothetical protein
MANLKLTRRERAWNETKAIVFAIALAVLFIVLSSLMTLARADGTTVVPVTASIEELAAQVFVAVRDGQWWPAAALGLSLLVSGLRKAGPRFLPDGKFKDFLLSDRGGVTVTLVLAVLGGVVNALTAGIPMGADWFFTVTKVAVASLGGYVGVKRLLFPSDAKVPAPAPPATVTTATPPPA